MRLINLKQNTDEWDEFRHEGRIGGSGLGGIWTAPSYTAEAIKELLVGRNFDFERHLEHLKNKNPRKRSLTAEDLKAVLTQSDKEELHMRAERKIGYYETIAQEIAIDPKDDEDEAQWRNPMDRGHGLEDAAAQDGARILGKNIAKVGCIVADAPEGTPEAEAAVYDKIYNSPDRIILPEDIVPVKYLTVDGDLDFEVYEQHPFDIVEEMEVKCLNAAKHLMIWDTKHIPEEYWMQNIQYFITNEKLETLYWVFHNPLVPIMPTFILVVNRDDLGHWPETVLRYQRRMIKSMTAFKDRLIAESSNLILPAAPGKGIE